MFQQLNSTLTYIKDFIVNNDLISLYQTLITQYQAALAAPADEETVKLFQETKKKIEDIHSYVNYSFFSAPKIKILEKLKASLVIGEAAIKRIGDAFSQFAGDKVVADLTTLKTETEQLLGRVQQTIGNLGLEADPRIEESADPVVELTITDQAYDNFWSIGERSESWKYILNLFTRVSGEKFEDVKIISIASGSDMSILMTGAKVALGFVLKVASAVADLKTMKDIFLKDKEELKSKYGLDKKTIELVIGERTTRYGTEYEEKKIAFALKIVKEFRGDKKDGENENELTNAVGMGIERMVKEAEVGTTVLNPKEIKAIEPPDPDSLGIVYQAEKKLAQEVMQTLKEEQDKLFLSQEGAMKKELTAQIKKAGLSEIDNINNKDQKKLEAETKSLGKGELSAAEVVSESKIKSSKEEKEAKT